MDQQFRLGEAVSQAYDVGGRWIGLRWSDRTLYRRLASLTTRSLGEQIAPSNVSVVVGRAEGHIHTKHQVYVQNQLVSVTAREGQLMRTVARAMAALATPASTGSISIDALLVLGASATAVDRRLATDLRAIEPRLRRRGVSFVELPRIVLDSRAHALIPDALGMLGISASAFEEQWPANGTDDRLVVGGVPIARIMYIGETSPASRAVQLSDLVQLVRDETGRVDAHDVSSLATVTPRVELIPIELGDRTALLEAMER